MRKEHFSIQHSPHTVRLALILIAGGISFAAAVVINTISHRKVISQIPHGQRLIRIANERQANNDPDQAKFFYGQAIDSARTPQQLTTALMAMLDFLLNTPSGTESHQTYLKEAKNYILAMGQMNMDAAYRPRLLYFALSTALATQDPELWQVAQELFSETHEEARPALAIDLKHFDATYLFESPAVAYSVLEQLEECYKESTDAQFELRTRRIQLLWKTLEDENLMNELSHFFQGQKPEEQRRQVLAQLEKVLLLNTRTGLIELEIEADVGLAIIALERNVPHEAIASLKKAIENPYYSDRRLQAGRMLLALLQEQELPQQAEALRLSMLEDAQLQIIAFNDIERALKAADDAQSIEALLAIIDEQQGMVRSPHQGIPASLLLCAAEKAIEINRFEHADNLIRFLQENDHDTARRPERLFLQAKLAEKQGHINAKIDALRALTLLHGNHPYSAAAWFMMVDTLAERPLALADMVGSIVAATIRHPRDPRSMKSLYRAAQTLESMGIHGMAAEYYRRSTLQGIVDSSEKNAAHIANAMLGQARGLIAMRQYIEADSLLRKLNTHAQWASAWPQSGPLWSALAIHHGQYKEAVRRWRQTCGPPADSILADMFGIIEPNAAQVQARLSPSPRQPPAPPPALLMQTAAEASLKQLLNISDYDRIDQLLNMIAKHPDWREQVPLQAFRIQTLQHIMQNDSSERAVEWLGKQPVQMDAARTEGIVLDQESLNHLLTTTQQTANRIRSRLF